MRQIIDAQRTAGISTQNIAISGGAGQHSLTRQLLADACGLPVLAPAGGEPVLLGSAMLGAVAGGAKEDLPAAMRSMSLAETTYAPDEATLDLHDRRYEAFRQLQSAARGMRDI